MLPLLAAALIAGTAGMSMVKPPSLDVIEYSHVVQLTSATTQAIQQCGDDHTDIKEIVKQSEMLVEYETHLTDGKEKLQVAKEINYLAKQFESKDKYSIRYCQHKLSEIQSVSRTLARSIGGLHKVDICNADFNERFKLYEASYENKRISFDEYKELIEDIKHISKTDRSACSVENGVKLDQATEIADKLLSVLGAL